MNRRFTNQSIYIQGNLYLNLWDCQSSPKVNNAFVTGPTRISINNVTFMEHSNVNSFVNSSLTTGIFKVHVSDHFQVFRESCIISSWHELRRLFRQQAQYKQKKYRIIKTKKSQVATLYNVIYAYNWFPEIFTGLYDIYFPKRKVEIKQKTFSSTWLTKGLL